METDIRGSWATGLSSAYFASCHRNLTLPWRPLEAVEFATLEWVEWFNNRRLLAPIGNVPPTAFEQQYYLAQEAPVMKAGVNE